MGNQTASPVLNLSAAAEYLGIDRRTLYRLMARSDIDYVRVSPGRRVLRIADLDAYLSRQRVARRTA